MKDFIISCLVAVVVYGSLMFFTQGAHALEIPSVESFMLETNELIRQKEHSERSSSSPSQRNTYSAGNSGPWHYHQVSIQTGYLFDQPVYEVSNILCKEVH